MSTESFSSNPSTPNNFTPETVGALGEPEGGYVGVNETSGPSALNKAIDNSQAPVYPSSYNELGGITQGSAMQAVTDQLIYQGVVPGSEQWFAAEQAITSFFAEQIVTLSATSPVGTLPNELLDIGISGGTFDKIVIDAIKGIMPAGMGYSTLQGNIIELSLNKTLTVLPNAVNRTAQEDWRTSLTSSEELAQFISDGGTSLASTSPRGVLANELSSIVNSSASDKTVGGSVRGSMPSGLELIGLGVIKSDASGKTRQEGIMTQRAGSEIPIVNSVIPEDYISISRRYDNMFRDARMISIEDLIDAIEMEIINPHWGNIQGEITDQIDLVEYIDTLILPEPDLTVYVLNTGNPVDVDLGMRQITANAVITPTVYTDTISSLFGNPGLSISNKALYDGISTSLSWLDRVTYDTNGVPSTNWQNRQLLDSSGIPSIDWQGREAYDSSGITSLSWSGRAFYDNSGVVSFTWSGRELINSLGRTVYSYEQNLMYAFNVSQHAVIDVGGQILYDIADQSSIRWSTRDIYASDGSTVVANYTNSTGMRLYGSTGTGFSSGSFTQSARIHAHSLTGIATYQKTTNSTTGALSTDGFDVGISASGVAEIRQRENLALEIYTNNNLQATMSATGNFGIGVVPSAKLHIRAGTSTAGTAPLKYVSGPLLTTPEGGAQEFLTDKYYATISTGTARKEFTLNDIALTAGRVPYTTTNGRMTDSANLTFNGFNLTQKGQINAITFVTGTYSVLTTDCYMFCPTGGTFTVTLPTAVGRSGQAYTVHNSATGVTTIATTSSQTINGALTVVLSTRYSSRTVVSDGSNWFITALV